MKKILSVLLSIMLVLSMTCITTFAEGTLRISGENVSHNLTVGEIVHIKINVDENPGFVSGSITLSWDKSALELTDVEYGFAGKDSSSAAIVSGISEYTPVFGDTNRTSDYTNTGTLLTLVFKVLEGATAKNYTISIAAGSDDFSNNELTEVAVTAAPATLTLTAPTVAVTGISLNKTTLALTEGDSETLTATITPDNATDKTVTWSSSKKGVATVDANGKVTAVAVGDAIITAKAGDKTATCTVTVSAAPCTHPTKTEVAEKASTCAEKGWDAYKKCNDCGQLFNTSGNEISEIPYRALSTTHTEGTPATCTTKAVCSVCHQSYGDFAAHQYTKQAKTADTLKSAGTCKDKALYWYSCAVCDKVEKNDSHSFEGDKAANNHVGETTLVNVKDPVHNTQTPGYTGDTKCLGCDAIIARGSSIPADQHVAGDEWTSDGESHWKTCKVEGCNAVIESTKSAHTPSAWVNVGDGYHLQTCIVCERELTHEECTFGQPLKYNANSHWEECTKCGMKQNEAAHEFLPDSDKCISCDYTKSSNITIITPTQPGDSKPAEGNPSTGAVSSPVGYVFVGLAAVGALCFGAKKLAKKHE